LGALVAFRIADAWLARATAADIGLLLLLRLLRPSPAAIFTGRFGDTLFLICCSFTGNQRGQGDFWGAHAVFGVSTEPP